MHPASDNITALRVTARYCRDIARARKHTQHVLRGRRRERTPRMMITRRERSLAFARDTDTTFASRNDRSRAHSPRTWSLYRERKSRAVRSSSQPGASDPSSSEHGHRRRHYLASLLTLSRALLALPAAAARPSVNAPDTDLPTVLPCVARDIKHKHRAVSRLDLASRLTHRLSLISLFLSLSSSSASPAD